MRYTTGFDEPPGLGFEAAKWVLALIVLFGGGWLGETAGRSTGSDVVAALFGIATALGMFCIFVFREDVARDEADPPILSRPWRIGWFVILAGLLGPFVLRTVLRLADNPNYKDSTTMGFVLGLIVAGAIGHWRKYRALKRQQFP